MPPVAMCGCVEKTLKGGVIELFVVQFICSFVCLCASDQPLPSDSPRAGPACFPVATRSLARKLTDVGQLLARECTRSAALVVVLWVLP